MSAVPSSELHPPPITRIRSGAVTGLRQLFSDGALEIVTPPSRDPDAMIDARTVIQIDGDVITFVSDPAATETLRDHFARVRSRLNAMAALRGRVLAMLFLPPAVIALWKGGFLLAAFFGPGQSPWMALWPNLTWLAMALAFALAVPWLVPRILKLMVWMGRRRLGL